MSTVKFQSQSALEQEIMNLEAEVERVAALSITTDISRADLVDRLLRVKQKAGIVSR
jgi:hypothetical protein